MVEPIHDWPRPPGSSHPEYCKCGEKWGHDWSPLKHGYKVPPFGWIVCKLFGHAEATIDGELRCRRCFYFIEMP